MWAWVWGAWEWVRAWVDEDRGCGSLRGSYRIAVMLPVRLGFVPQVLHERGPRFDVSDPVDMALVLRVPPYGEHKLGLGHGHSKSMKGRRQHKARMAWAALQARGAMGRGAWGCTGSGRLGDQRVVHMRVRWTRGGRGKGRREGEGGGGGGREEEERAVNADAPIFCQGASCRQCRS